MKLLTILLLAVLVVLVFLVSCGDNSGGPGDDDIIRPDTERVPPTDTLGTDTLVTLRDELMKGGGNIKCIYYGTEWTDNGETMEHIKKRKGVDQTQEKSIVYYQVVKRTFKYKY